MRLGMIHNVASCPFTKSDSGPALTRQFAIVSLIIIGLITAALSFIISYYLRKDPLEREWRITADFIRTELLQHLSPADFSAPQSTIAQERF